MCMGLLVFGFLLFFFKSAGENWITEGKTQAGRQTLLKKRLSTKSGVEPKTCIATSTLLNFLQLKWTSSKKHCDPVVQFHLMLTTLIQL